jgi:soluble cytochrome b562
LAGALGGAPVRKCLNDLTEDELQNQLILIVHHLDDAEEGMKKGDLDYAKASLKDIREVVDHLKQFISPALADEVGD